MKSLILSCYILLIGLVTAATASAQDPTRSYLIKLPTGYKIETVDSTLEEGVVEAYMFDTDILSTMPFDTTNAVEIGDNIIFGGEYIPTVSNELLKDRLSCIEGEIPLTFHPQVRNFVDKFTVSNRKFAQNMLSRKNLYFPIYERIFDEYGIPDEMKYLSIVESGLNPKARSRAAAVGPWQFIASTGRLFGLNTNYYMEERQDIEKSTRAAAKYLKHLYDYFDGDWELALAAYNCGPGNVRKAMRRSGKKEYWDIYDYLPRETRNYLPSFVAVMYTMSYAEEHNLIADEVLYPIETEEIFINQHLDLSTFAEQIGVCPSDLIEINPELRLNYVPSTAQNYALKIPSNRLPYFLANQDSILKASRIPTASKYRSEEDENPLITSSSTSSSSEKVLVARRHQVRRGQNLGSIASQYGTTVTKLKTWNRIRGTFIYPGQSLIVGYTSKIISTPSSASANTPGKRTSHRVRSGETLGGIAKRYGVTVEDIKSWNSLRSNVIRVNWTLTVSPPTDKSTAPNPTRPPYHTVVKGDGLTKIANMYGISVDEIRQWNDLRTFQIYPGNRLRLSDPNDKPTDTKEPEEKIHVVLRGENLSEIAQEHNITIAEIRKWNEIDGEQITPGQKLYLTPPKEKQITTLIPKLNLDAPTNGYHEVQKGETIHSIAKKYGLTAAQLKAINSLSQDEIQPKQILSVDRDKIPATPAPKPTVPAKPALPSFHLVEKGQTLSYIARTYNLPIAELKTWNGLEQGQVKAGQMVFLNKEAALENKKANTPAKHIVQAGETLFSIARDFEIPVADLRKWNNLDKNDKLQKGQELSLVPVQDAPEPEKQTINQATIEAPPAVASKPIVARHQVSKGETLSSIAKKYDLSISDLRAWNDLSSDRLSIGQSLVLKEYLAKSKPTPKPDPTTEPAYHIVKKGESLYKIAQDHNVDPKELARINDLSAGNIHPGQKLKLPTDEDSPSSNTGVTIRESNGDTYHLVQRGESLHLIANKYKTTVARLIQLNNLTSNSIQPFQKLLVKTNRPIPDQPAETTKKYHTVKKGDNLWEIAKKYRTTVSSIKNLNNIKDNDLKPGQKLRVK